MEPNISAEKIKSITSKINDVVKGELDNHFVSSVTITPNDCDDPSGICGPGKKMVIDTTTGQPICIDC